MLVHTHTAADTQYKWSQIHTFMHTPRCIGRQKIIKPLIEAREIERWGGGEKKERIKKVTHSFYTLIEFVKLLGSLLIP